MVEALNVLKTIYPKKNYILDTKREYSMFISGGAGLDNKTIIALNLKDLDKEIIFYDVIKINHQGNTKA